MNFIRVHQPLVPSQLSECGGAGTGCGWCVPFLRRLFEAAKEKAAANIELSAEDYARQRADYVNNGSGRPPSGAEPLPTVDRP